MPNRLSSAIKAFAMTWGGGGYNGSGWERFDKLTDPWPRNARYSKQTSAGDAYLNSVVATCIAWMQRAFPEPELRVYSREGDEVVDKHPLVRLFRRPNPYYSSARLWQCVVRDWVLTGNAYLRKDRTNGGDIGALWYIPARLIAPDWPKDPKTHIYISHYNYGVGGKPEPIPPEDIVHFRFGEDPNNARLGWSPILAGLRELSVLNEGADYRRELIGKTGVPPYMATPKDTTKPITPEIAAHLKTLFKNLVRAGASEPLMIPTVPMEFTRLGFSPQDLDILAMMGWDAEVVCSLIGLSAMVVNLPSNSRTYTNYPEAYRAAVEHNLIPTQTMIAQELDVQLLDDMGDPETQYVGWDYSKVRALQEDENKKWARVINAGAKGFLLKNEVRDRLDTTLEDLPDDPPPPALIPESTGDAAALAEGQQEPPAALNGAGITAGRFKALVEVFE